MLYNWPHPHELPNRKRCLYQRPYKGGRALLCVHITHIIISCNVHRFDEDEKFLLFSMPDFMVTLSRLLSDSTANQQVLYSEPQFKVLFSTGMMEVNNNNTG